jgi:hypothetical protein
LNAGATFIDDPVARVVIARHAAVFALWLDAAVAPNVIGSASLDAGGAAAAQSVIGARALLAH